MYIQLEDERGNALRRVDDPRVAIVVERLRPSGGDEASACWRFIDGHGDTTFNRLQMTPFLNELAQLSSKASSEDDAVISAIRAMAMDCQRSIHRYLKFYGD